MFSLSFLKVAIWAASLLLFFEIAVAEPQSSHAAIFNGLHADLFGTRDLSHPSDLDRTSHRRVSRQVSRQVIKPDTSRNGNWVHHDCRNKAVAWLYDYFPTDRWNAVDANDAWHDIVRIYKDVDEKNGFEFDVSVTRTIGTFAIYGYIQDPQCRNMIRDTCSWTSACPDDTDTCSRTIECLRAFNFEDSGPAAMLIWNSLVELRRFYRDFGWDLRQSTYYVHEGLETLEETFAAESPDGNQEIWFNALADLAALGTVTFTGASFIEKAKSLAYTSVLEGADERLKDIALALLQHSIPFARNVSLIQQSGWTSGNRNFTTYMGQAIDSWETVASESLDAMFNGSDASIDTIWGIISRGKLVDGDREKLPTDGRLQGWMKMAMPRIFFGYVIPTLWQASKANAFILDSGQSCDETPDETYLSKNTMNATGACVDGKQYYLVYPKGSSGSKFSMPPGLDVLDGSVFGGIKREDFIKGSVLTYMENGEQNVGRSPDLSKNSTLEVLLDYNITAPGFIRIPVCSGERAHKTWQTSSRSSTKNWPCDLPLAKRECDDSTYENETTDASPLIKDCKIIIENIQGDGGTKWTTQVIGKKHREILTAGTCAFGIEATQVNGNVNFNFGGGDVIDIITKAIDEASRGDKVGAKGNVKCKGNIKKQAVKWGIYHT